MDEVEELIAELRESGYTTVDEVSNMLIRTNDAFLAREQESPPGNELGAKFHGLGVVRASLELDETR